MSAAPIRLPFSLTRSFLRRMAACLAGVLLSAQLAVAAYACPGIAAALGAEPQQASAPVAAASTPMPGCEGMNGATGAAYDPAAPNLCAEHCRYGKQSDQSATLNVPAAVLALLYATPTRPEKGPMRPAAAPISALVAASPPHAIAHCVYRI
ncbi:MAG: hypothetical protein KIT60_29640 [Burkholderiaceae bacterium]|nr:hypothetical protein [Burkholderiaceae bacterium]